MFWRKDGRSKVKENAAPSDLEAGSILYLVTENGPRRKFVDCVTAQPVGCVYADEAESHAQGRLAVRHRGTATLTERVWHRPHRTAQITRRV